MTAPHLIRSVVNRINTLLLIRSIWFPKLVKIVWIVTLTIAIGVPVYVYALIANPYNLFGAMPTLREIENPHNDFSSELISVDGVSLGRFIRYNRSPVTFSDLSPDLVNTLLVSEDHRFHSHSGMDFAAYFRVIKGMITFSAQGGGSTLTQQTAKNLFRTREEELSGKLSKLAEPLEILISKTKEWIIAARLEENFTKEELIALYLNTVPFNNNAYGIKVAAETYFQKSPAELNIQESALLVGMLQGTTIYNPVAYPERAKRKRNEVIQKLYRLGYIASQVETDSLKALPLQLNFNIQNHNEGLAPYFRAALQNELLPWCKERGYDLFESGLKIYTTIDSRLQQYAEEAMREHMALLQKNFEADWGDRNPWVDDNGYEIENFLEKKIHQTEAYKVLKLTYGNNVDSINLKLHEKKSMRVFSWRGQRDTLFSTWDSLQYYYKFLHAGLLAVDPSTGGIKAWVGGINHTYFKYDHVRQATRQPGSTFKPFVYGAAIENGFSPCQLYYDIAPAIPVNGRIYQARNANGTFGDGKQYTIRQALARSLNSVSIQVIKEIRPENVASFAKRVGITTPLDPVYSLALGTSDVSLYDMVAAYSTFANLGFYIKPYYITRIEDQNGNVIENFFPVPKQVLNESTAYTMIHMLKGGVEEEGGSSRALSEMVKSENEVGGKTGTTDNGSDGWYMGVTHNLVAGVWVGGDERSIHFPHWGEGSGGKAALPIWDKFMQKVYANAKAGFTQGAFKRPVEFNINFDCDKYTKIDSLLTIQ
ncbi:transglycosylase domain-containing protein [Chryseosolibacter indicus]|uniref:Transglycosylase domain-containing protein n=1 Tax=Chryseosolibacter indicus TaxID=2782351 RepID=A0ABS5VMG7_9BACT|nr:transglycosylase domain-containing protein [Chryseosolibacter indicus]MBT1702203.1 transglycosylase domain-containing protein [Chryseosolibacter indicus]